MFSLTSRNKASLRAARCSQSVTTSTRLAVTGERQQPVQELVAVRVDTRERGEGDRALDARGANDRIATGTAGGPSPTRSLVSGRTACGGASFLTDVLRPR